MDADDDEEEGIKDCPVINPITEDFHIQSDISKLGFCTVLKEVL